MKEKIYFYLNFFIKLWIVFYVNPNPGPLPQWATTYSFLLDSQERKKLFLFELFHKVMNCVL